MFRVKGECGVDPYSYSYMSYSKDFYASSINGHGLLSRDNLRHYTKLQEGPVCPRLRVPNQARIDRSSDHSCP